MISCLWSKNVCGFVFILHAFIYLFACIMNKHEVPCAVAQNIIIKLATNENVKHIETWNRLNAQFRTDTLSRSQI